MNHLLLFEEDYYYNTKCLCTYTEFKCNTHETFKYCIYKKEIIAYCPYLKFLDNKCNSKLPLINNIKTTNLDDITCIKILKYIFTINHKFIVLVGAYYLMFTNKHIFETSKYNRVIIAAIKQFRTNIFIELGENTDITLITNLFEPYIVKNDIVNLKSILTNWIVMFEEMII
jgi:hypothetical protein